MARAQIAQIAPITFDEYVNLVPSNVPPPPVLEILQRYRSFIEAQIASLTPALVARASVLRDRGLRVPERFFPHAPQEPTREELIRVVVELYRDMLARRYASPGGPAGS